MNIIRNMIGKECDDTIVALSSPSGRSGVGIIRLSGPDAVSITKRVFKSRRLKQIDLTDRHATYGFVIDPETGRVIDDGIAVAMFSPSSYTGDDVVELSLHGSPVILHNAISLICSCGARLAKRGEFTRRAFLAGRLDLVQAEAIIDLIDSETTDQADDARLRIDRLLSHEISDISSGLKDVAAELEVFIDFDDDEEGDIPHPIGALQEVLKKMETLLKSSHSGRFRNRGLSAVITGKPNVGKSTLFNVLLGYERMIVSPVPGTTRDPVSEKAYIKGVAITLGDTAGVRSEPNPIEKEGIERTVRWVEESDISIVVLDSSQPLDDDDMMVLESGPVNSRIFALNKIDIATVHQDHLPDEITSNSPVRISAKTLQGIDELSERISTVAEAINRSVEFSEKGSLNDRALLLMEAAAENVKAALNNLESTGPLEMVSLEIRAACDKIDEITGQKFTDDVLDRVFERFCVGK